MIWKYGEIVIKDKVKFLAWLLFFSPCGTRDHCAVFYTFSCLPFVLAVIFAGVLFSHLTLIKLSAAKCLLLFMFIYEPEENLVYCSPEESEMDSCSF